MKAIVQRRYGPIDDLELREVQPPVPGDDEVLVRVHATSVHPDVWHVVRGRPHILRLLGAGVRRPHTPIPGTDMAGTVASVGRNVTRFEEGDAVFGETTPSHQWANGGAWAEYVTAKPEWLAAKPGDVPFEQAAAVPTSGYIALLNLRGGTAVRAGMEVLVNGAGGGVGMLALQIAKARGARVTAVDHTRKLDMLRALGADRVLDHTRDDFTRGDARYHLIVDVPGNHPFAACRRALTPEGKYVLIGHEHFRASDSGLLGLLPRMVGLMTRALITQELRLGRSAIPTRADAMAALRDLLAAGTLTPVIDRTFPLHEAPAALRYLAEGEPCGKVMISVAAPGR